MAGEWHEWPTNMTGIGSFMQFADSSVNGYLGLVIMIVSFAIMFMILKSTSTTKALAASSFVSVILAILLYRMEMLDIMYVIVSILLLVVMVIVSRNEAERFNI